MLGFGTMTIVLFGLNKTLIKKDIMGILALKYGFFYDLNRLKTNLKTGLISQKRFVREKMKLLKGRRVVEITNTVNDATLTCNVKKTLNNLRNEGFMLGVISDDLDIVTNPLAEFFKLDYVISHKAEIKNGRFTGNIAFVKNIDDYQNWKLEVVRDLKKSEHSDIISVGSENIDAPMLREAEVGISFNGSKNAEKSADIVIKKPDMDAVLNSILDTEL
jgi:phosphoserine phosphatase